MKMKTKKIKLVVSFNQLVVSWYNQTNDLHRDNDLPAQVIQFPFGNFERIGLWYNNGSCVEKNKLKGK